MKLLTVIGARPQFVKAAAVSRAVARWNAGARGEGIREIIVHTGQHYDRNMSDVFFEEMEIPRPDRFLAVHSLSHGAMTGRMLEAVEEVIVEEKPDAVLVYGDTNTTLAGALAAVKLHVPVAHVEAGLRSWNRRMPEEINRVLTDHAGQVLFCPTETAVRNLEAEGIRDGEGGARVYLSGDVMLDAALFYAGKAPEAAAVFAGEPLLSDLSDKSFALATVHRADNTDDPERLSAIFGALSEIGRETPVVLPLHPRTRGRLAAAGIKAERLFPEVRVIGPVGYLSMLALLSACKLVLTDSGGLQKEAFFFGKPCVTLREETEWTELCGLGANVLAGCDADAVCCAARDFASKRPDFSAKPYGEGRAADGIVEILAGLDMPAFFGRTP